MTPVFETRGRQLLYLSQRMSGLLPVIISPPLHQKLRVVRLPANVSAVCRSIFLLFLNHPAGKVLKLNSIVQSAGAGRYCRTIASLTPKTSASAFQRLCRLSVNVIVVLESSCGGSIKTEPHISKCWSRSILLYVLVTESRLIRIVCWPLVFCWAARCVKKYQYSVPCTALSDDSSGIIWPFVGIAVLDWWK